MTDAPSMLAGAVHGGVRTWLRVEGIAAVVLAALTYRQLGSSWLLFVALFLIPDISFAGYLAGPRIGAAIYNAAHSYVGPLVLAIATRTSGAGLAIAMIWAAHVGFDRALGYGLKYPSAFKDTHLGRIGRSP
jgi:hypothetical protein